MVESLFFPEFTLIPQLKVILTDTCKQLLTHAVLVSWHWCWWEIACRKSVADQWLECSLRTVTKLILLTHIRKKTTKKLMQVMALSERSAWCNAQSNTCKSQLLSNAQTCGRSVDILYLDSRLPEQEVLRTHHKIFKLTSHFMSREKIYMYMYQFPFTGKYVSVTTWPSVRQGIQQICCAVRHLHVCHSNKFCAKTQDTNNPYLRSVPLGLRLY